MPASQLAAACGGTLEGPDPEVRAAAPLESASAGQLAFVANPKFYQRAQASPAVLLVRDDYSPAPNQVLIRVANPRAAFAQAIAMLYPTATAVIGIHPSAIVDPGARIDATASIGPHCVIAAGASIGAHTRLLARVSVGEDSSIGEHCVLHPGVTIYSDVRIGDRAILHAGAVVGADGFGFEFAQGRYHKFPQIGSVEIGDDCELGANTCIDRAALGVTRVGNGVKLDNMVHIGHNCSIGNHVVIAAQTGLAGGVIVEDFAVIGGQVGIGDKARVEKGAILGSGAGVLTSKVVRAGEVMWGTPARPLKQYLEQLANLSRLGKVLKRLDQRTSTGE